MNNKKQEELNDDMMPSFLDQSKLNEINSKMEFFYHIFAT